jgi:hypothetical protein
MKTAEFKPTAMALGLEEAFGDYVQAHQLSAQDDIASLDDFANWCRRERADWKRSRQNT